jgi:hypothetical protein
MDMIGHDGAGVTGVSALANRLRETRSEYGNVLVGETQERMLQDNSRLLIELADL